MEDRTESPSSAKVRDLIFAYESQSSVAEPLEDHYGRPRAKSIGNALSYKHFRKPVLEFHNIMDIEKELVKIEAHLNYYEIYDKETHVAFQEQLFSVLTSIVSIDPEDHEEAVKLKKKLIQETQKVAKILNSKLPFDVSHSYKGIRRTYSTLMRKEDAVVSTTSVRNQEHKAIFSSHTVTLNGGYKSEESLNSTRDSVDASLRHDESSVDLNHHEESARSNTPPPQIKLAEEAQSTIIPSVSKLKKFFSFRREAKPETKIISASNSGVSRSQSLNIKTSKYTITKRRTNVDSSVKENVICENDESIENSHNLQEDLSFISQNQNASHLSSTTFQADTSKIHEHLESENHADDSKETQNETLNVSVSKLKSLFETNKTETDEGLGLLIKKPNDFVTDFNIPFTAMNLGSYRLKRTISGNYMNFTGLLRNVEINKRTDLSKSKSLSDLKSTNLSYTSKDFDIDDLSNEIDDADDFAQVSIDASKNTKEINNNIVADDKEVLEKVSTTETGETVKHDNEVIVSSASVESLKQTFENLSHGTATIYRENGGDIRHVKTTETNNGPVYKVSVQQTTGHTSQGYSSSVTENLSFNSATLYKENTSEAEHVITKTTVGTTKGPLINVPVQLKGGYTSYSEKLTASGTEENSGEDKHVIRKLTNGSSKGPMIRVPAQLRTSYASTVQHGKTTEAGYQSKTVSSQKKEITLQATHKENKEHSQEEVLVKVPQLPEVIYINQKENAAVTENNTNKTSEIVSSTETMESLKQTVGTLSTEDSNTIYKTIGPVPGANESDEPILKIPIQLRVGISNFNEVKVNLEESEKVDATKEITHETVETSSAGTVDTLRQTFENVAVTEKTIDNKSAFDTSETVSSTGTVESLKHTIGTVHAEDSNTICKTIEPISGANESDEPILKIPIQLRVGISNFNENKDNLEESKKVDATEEITQETVETMSAGTVDTLRQTFENVGSLRSNDVNTSPYKIIQPIPGADGSEEPVLKVPIQLRVGISNFSEKEVNGNEEILTDDSQVQESVSKISVQQSLRQNTSEKESVKYTGNNTLTISEQCKKVPLVDVTVYNDGTVDQSILLSEGTMSRAKISEKTDTFMKLLESPRTFSTIVSSSSSQGHVSSTSNIATSYAEKQTVQHSSSSHVSQRITTSSSLSSSFSSQLSGQNYLKIIKEPISYSSLSIKNSENEDVSVIVTEPDEEEVRKSKINLNISQENILAEILNETDSLENIDEEFEKIIEKK